MRGAACIRILFAVPPGSFHQVASKVGEIKVYHDLCLELKIFAGKLIEFGSWFIKLVLNSTTSHQKIGQTLPVFPEDQSLIG